MQAIYPEAYPLPVPAYSFDAWHQVGGPHPHRTGHEQVGAKSTGPWRNSFDFKSSETRSHPTVNQSTYPEPPASQIPVPPYVTDAYASGEKLSSPQEVEDSEGDCNRNCTTNAEDDDDTFDCAVDCRCVFAEGEVDEYNVDVDVDFEMGHDVVEEMVFDNATVDDDDDDFDCAVECRCVFADGEVDEYDMDGDDMAAYNRAIIVPRL
ncbi:hypothetical protein R3P38DRAFT_2759168 [Favolaschia claudopus]|uniref:Uncharacterized protein n=1 Tax=Favolaschia claudopus TaxID=2862362 RepID=A0AAW0E7B5_9AGAR